MPKIWRTFTERRGETDARKREEARRMDYRMTFGTEQGQRVLADILLRCGLMQTSHRPGAPDETAFQEGRRRAGLEIVEVLAMNPDDALRLARTGQTEDLFRHDDA